MESTQENFIYLCLGSMEVIMGRNLVDNWVWRDRVLHRKSLTIYPSVAYGAKTVDVRIDRSKTVSTPTTRGRCTNGLRICAVVLLAAFAFVFGVRNAPAYEGEHYVWTYYIALHMGFTERQAYQIASGTYAVDWDVDTGPMPHGLLDKIQAAYAASDEKRFRTKWRRFHAFGAHGTIKAMRRGGARDHEIRSVVEGEMKTYEVRLWRLAVAQENPGPYLHFRQDRYSHGGWADVLGHGPAGHIPDYFASDPDAAWRMTEDTISQLYSFRRAMCKKRRKAYCRVPLRNPNRPRLRKVFWQLVRVNHLPRRIDDVRSLVDELRRYSLKFENSASVAGRFYGNAVFGLSGVEAIFLKHGITKGFYDFAVQDEGPRLTRSVNVVRRAIAQDKRARDRRRRLTYFPNYDLIGAGRDPARMPLKWIQYNVNSNASHIGIPAQYAVEDVILTVGTPKVSYRKTNVGTGRDAVVDVILDLPIAVRGMAPKINFLSSLPTAILSTPDGADAINGRSDTRTDIERVGNGKRRIRRTIRRRAADLWSGLSWQVELHVYSLKPVRLVVPLKMAVERRRDRRGITQSKCDCADYKRDPFSHQCIRRGRPPGCKGSIQR